MNAQAKTAVKTAETEAAPEASIVRHSEPKTAPLAVIRRDDIATQNTVRPVLSAIALVMGKVGSVEKRGENKFHGYAYATAADIAQALQRHMAEAGLVVIQREIGVNHDHETGILAVRYEFTVMHSTGDCLDPVQMTGMATAKNSKGGFDDKATNKCHTAARKYFLLGLFQIPTGDYPDADAGEDQPDQKVPAPNGNGQQQAKAQPKQEPTKTVDQKPAQKPSGPVFTVLTATGAPLTFNKGADYLVAIETEFGKAEDKIAFWDANSTEFQSWHTKLVQLGNNQQAIADFGRIGKDLADTVFLLNSQNGG